jgi:hypothetical protein
LIAANFVGVTAGVTSGHLPHQQVAGSIAPPKL